MLVRMFLRLAIAVSLFSAVALAQTGNNPTKEWERSKPEAAGFSSKRLDALKGYLATGNTTGMMIVQGGKAIFEYGDVTRQTMIASARKSLMTLLYGKYVANGRIKLDATLGELGIDDVGGLLPIEKGARVRDVIAARSGVFHKNSNPDGGDDLDQAPPRGTQQPGSFFLYNNWDFNVAGHIFEQQTGLNIFDAFQKDIAEPIGMQDFDRSLQRKSAADPTLSKYPAYRFVLTARDMARVGQLMLQEGRWSGRQVIPTEWIKQITAVATPFDQMYTSRRGFATQPWGYGYMWWVYDDRAHRGWFRNAYAAKGNGGQFITVLPEMSLVLAHTAPSVEPGKPTIGVTELQYQAAVMQLIGAFCGQCQ